MIVPIAREPEWTRLLESAQPWLPPLTPTVILAPHPDDETLAAGGLIAMLREHGVEVSTVAVTDGENCYPGEAGLGPLRKVEQTRALARLGVAPERIHRLRLTDSGVAADEDDLVVALDTLLRDTGHIVAPWPHDFHPDHESTGRAAQVIARRYGIPLTWYFFWTWHRGTPALLQDLPLRRLSLTADQQLAKREALLFHQSQLQHSSGSPILPEDLLEPAWRSYEVFLPG